MLTCLTVIGRASTALANGETERGQDILSSVINCSKRDTCHSRKMCSTATTGILKSSGAGQGVA